MRGFGQGRSRGGFRAKHQPAYEATSEAAISELSCAVCKCDEAAEDLFKLECEHYYCFECLQTWLEFSCVNRASWPARCCGIQLDLDKVAKHVKTGPGSKLLAKAFEYSTKKPVYCSNGECAAFLGPACDKASPTPVACTAGCGTITCLSCKCADHCGVCEEQVVPQDVLNLIEEHNWQSCPSCNHVIEMTYGCNKVQSVYPVLSIGAC